MPNSIPSVEGGFKTILADPPWRFQNRTGKVAPEHRRLGRYATMSLEEICQMPVADRAAKDAHLYLWVPNALLPDGLQVMSAWGFRYVSNLVWAKRRKDGGPDGRGVGFYFRNTTELILFGVKGSMRTLPPARSQVNILETRKREHSRKPDEQYPLIESCSPAPRLELFARYARPGWYVWGDESSDEVTPQGQTHRGYQGGPLSVTYTEPHQRLDKDVERILSQQVSDRYRSGASIRQISQETELSITRVRRLLKMSDTPIRKRGAQRQETRLFAA